MKTFISLLQSRKFWLALIAFIVAAVLFVQGQISPEQFVDAVIALVGVLVAAIAIEDAALKMSLTERGVRK